MGFVYEVTITEVSIELGGGKITLVKGESL